MNDENLKDWNGRQVTIWSTEPTENVDGKPLGVERTNQGSGTLMIPDDMRHNRPQNNNDNNEQDNDK